MRFAWCLVVALACSACGSRSGLWVGESSGQSGGSGGVAGASGGSGGAAGVCVEATWARSIGSSEDLEGGVGVATGPGCDAVLAATVRGPFDAGGGPLPAGMLLARYAAGGEARWSRSFGDESGNLLADVAFAPGGSVVAVGHLWEPVAFDAVQLSSAGKWDVFAVSLDADGNTQWAKAFGDGDYQHAHRLAVDGAGNVVLVGDFASSIDFGLGPLVATGGLSNVFIAKLSSDGTPLFNRSFGDEEVQLDPLVAIDKSGSIAFAGWFSGSMDFGEGPLVSAGKDDVYVARLSPSGDTLWAQRFGDERSQRALAIAIARFGWIVVGGQYQGAPSFGGEQLPDADQHADAWVAAFGTGGTPIFSYAFHATQFAEVSAIAALDDGRIFVAGASEGDLTVGSSVLDGQGKRDLFVVELDTFGELVAGRRVGGPGTERTARMSVDDAGEIWLTGAFEESFTVPEVGPLSNVGGSDALLLRLFP